MKRVIGFIFAAILACSCSNKATVSNSGEVSLSGTWQFLASNEIEEAKVLEENYTEWDTLTVPGNWDTTERYSVYKGKGYYQKTFEVPSNWNQKQIRIKFGAVYQTAKVWLNGTYLGKNVGGYLPFEFNITDLLKKGEKNSVVVMADNTIRRGAWWAWGGISRSVKLVADNDVRAVYQHISAIPNFETKQVAFTIDYKLENNGEASVDVAIKSEVEGLGTLAAKTVSVASGEVKNTVVRFTKKLSDFKLWDLETPNLYQLKSSFSIEGTSVDGLTDNFGVRKFEVKGEQFFLNNKSVRLNGVNRVHDHPAYGNTEPDELVEKDMKDMMSLGCRFSRLMHAPLSKNILEFCDKNGFLLVEEIPVWGDADPQSYPNNPLTKKWMKTLIQRDFNHPSVVAWSVGNELRDSVPSWKNKAMTKAQYDYANDMLDYVAELDSTRLKTYVTITSYRKGEIGTEPYEKVDFISMNSYGPAPILVERTHEKFPNRPIFVSEIGKGQIGPAPDAVFSDELLGYLYELKKYPYVTGISLWSYNDYRSDYKGTPESGFREWGIVSETREKKKAYQQLKDVYEDWEVKE